MVMACGLASVPIIVTKIPPEECSQSRSCDEEYKVSNTIGCRGGIQPDNLENYLFFQLSVRRLVFVITVDFILGTV